MTSVQQQRKNIPVLRPPRHNEAEENDVIFNLGANCRRAVNYTLHPIYCLGTRALYPMVDKLMPEKQHKEEIGEKGWRKRG